MTTAPPFAPAMVLAGSVPEGKRLDFLTRRTVNDTPEEYVRQNLERALVEQYRYPSSACLPEFPVKVGSSRKRVDIAVFSGEARTQENIWLIVETKRQGTSAAGRVDGVEQLRSYMAACLNSRYGLWTNGEDRVCLSKQETATGHLIVEILEIPGYGQTEEDAQRPTRRDLRPATADNLLFAFRRCHNYIAANEGKQKPEAFWELLKIIFCKIEDERSRTLDFYVTPAERTNGTPPPPARPGWGTCSRTR